ncbi:MAG: hypothetical protein DRI30_01780 [Chloroflexi bacterium]|nr:MAG: hypothetical protein DRI30_01780 [Chloroflexota bacterium]
MVVIGTYHSLVAYDPVAQASDIHSRLVIVETAIDSDQVQNDDFVSDVHSRLVVVETSIDSDQLVDATATSNIHSHLVVMETANDSDQVIISDAILVAQTDLDAITDGDGVILGAAGVDLIWDEVINGANHNTTNTSGRRLRELRESGFYSDGFVYIDTVNGAADTTDYEAGTEVNPTNTMTRANTIAASLGLSKFKIIPGSTITLLAAQTNQLFEGASWTLALGSQNISGSSFEGATVTGIATNTTGNQFFCDCLFGAVTVPTDTHFLRCGLSGTITAGEVGAFFFDNCHSAIAGTGSVEFDFATPASETNLNIRHHSGGWNISNMGAGAGTCNASFEGNGQIVWNASCAATSNASIRGNWKITDNASGAVTETHDDTTAAVTVIASDTIVIDAAVSDVESNLLLLDTAIDSDQVQNDNFVSDVHSRLVVMETANDSDQVIISDAILIIDTAIDSDQVQNDDFVSNIHSRLVIIETSIDSDQLVDATATSNIHSKLVVMETANDSDQLVLSDAILVIDDLLDTEIPAITSNLLIIASDTLAIEASASVLVSGTSDSGSTTTMVDAARTEGDTDYWVGDSIVFTSGNISGQTREITAFNFTTNTITFSPATTQTVIVQNYDIISATAAQGLTAAQASDLALTEVENSNIHSRLVVMETANDSDQVIISDAILIIDTAINSDQVQNDNFVSDIHSRLVVMETANDSDQVQIEASIDSDQLLDIAATSQIHSRLVIMETANDSDQVILSDAILIIDTAIDSDQLVDATATSNIHSRLVVIETAIDSDQVQTEASIDSDQLVDNTATSNIHSRLVIIEASIDSDQAQTEASIDSDQVQNDDFVSNIHSRLIVIETAIDSDQVINDATADTIASDLILAQADLDTISDGIIISTTKTGTDTTASCSTNLSGYTDDQLIGRIITFTSGVADGESSDITDYANTNGVITFTAMTLACGAASGVSFKIT